MDTACASSEVMTEQAGTADLVRRLREQANAVEESGLGAIANLYREAADALESQQKEIAELQTLAKIGTWHDECRLNRQQAARELQKSQAVIDKLADEIKSLNAALAERDAEIARLKADIKVASRIPSAWSEKLEELRDRAENAEAEIARLQAAPIRVKAQPHPFVLDDDVLADADKETALRERAEKAEAEIARLKTELTTWQTCACGEPMDRPGHCQKTEALLLQINELRIDQLGIVEGLEAALASEKQSTFAQDEIIKLMKVALEARDRALAELKAHAEYALNTTGHRTRPPMFIPSVAKRVLEIVETAALDATRKEP
jgi:hypothetical protein